MLFPIAIAIVVLIALANASRSGAARDLIVHRPYGNRYSDASGAREE